MMVVLVGADTIDDPAGTLPHSVVESPDGAPHGGDRDHAVATAQRRACGGRACPRLAHLVLLLVPQSALCTDHSVVGIRGAGPPIFTAGL